MSMMARSTLAASSRFTCYKMRRGAGTMSARPSLPLQHLARGTTGFPVSTTARPDSSTPLPTPAAPNRAPMLEESATPCRKVHGVFILYPILWASKPTSVLAVVDRACSNSLGTISSVSAAISTDPAGYSVIFSLLRVFTAVTASKPHNGAMGSGPRCHRR